MISQVLSHMDGVSIFATLPLIMFMLMFGAVVFWALRLDKTKVNQWSNIPLNQDRLSLGDKLKNDRPDGEKFTNGER